MVAEANVSQFSLAGNVCYGNNFAVRKQTTEQRKMFLPRPKHSAIQCCKLAPEALETMFSWWLNLETYVSEVKFVCERQKCFLPDQRQKQHFFSRGICFRRG